MAPDQGVPLVDELDAIATTVPTITRAGMNAPTPKLKPMDVGGKLWAFDADDAPARIRAARANFFMGNLRGSGSTPRH
jgi:hypothetical protein